MHELSEDDLRLVEALLLASPGPVTPAQLQHALGDELGLLVDVPAVIAAVAERYRGRGIEVAAAGGGWRLRTAPDLAPRLAGLLGRERPLPRAALEVLAAIALHQPVTRAEVTELRQAAVAQATFDLLVDLGLIAPAGQDAGPGRAQLWRTTTVFLEHFGLRSLADLPRADHLAALARARGQGGGPGESSAG
ncbi:SMC-Scp complex subunit ScpB [Roseicella aquatilis]|uniref:SMC-Scp complex subunit ScpB n=1 Tax=Roseicella aquatilis TaxID=2527868 RepID=A0A4R4DMH5_9PROT|nr:SMC-Scp complex subunit ScpB [Roseicella aquatilis]TCZ61067.1 SMC-Scp complex subunit ScpB [Roseicella aquatilis]